MCSYSGQQCSVKDIFFISVLKWKAPIPRKEPGSTHTTLPSWNGVGVKKRNSDSDHLCASNMLNIIMRVTFFFSLKSFDRNLLIAWLAGQHVIA